MYMWIYTNIHFVFISVFSFERVTYAIFKPTVHVKCVFRWLTVAILPYTKENIFVCNCWHILAVFLNCAENSGLNSAALTGHSPWRGLWKLTFFKSCRLCSSCNRDDLLSDLFKARRPTNSLHGPFSDKVPVVLHQPARVVRRCKYSNIRIAYSGCRAFISISRTQIILFEFLWFFLVTPGVLYGVL
jgi:hypothetical protein